MRKTSFALALLTAAVLTACGGNGPSAGNQTPKTKFSNQITFGDSLSDVGTYAVGAVAALGGGKYTINGNNTAVSPELTGKNYTTLMVAAQLGLPAPCAAQTGLLGTAAAGFSVPVVDHPECFNYAQGGARVTNPIGPGNKALDKPGAVSLGQMTVPVVTQIANHLKKVGGKFKGDELVIVMAGGNDALEQLGELSAGGTAAGGQALATSLVTQLAPGTTNPATGAAAIGAADPGRSRQADRHAADHHHRPRSSAAVQNGNTGRAGQRRHDRRHRRRRRTGAGRAVLDRQRSGPGQEHGHRRRRTGRAGQDPDPRQGRNYVVVNNLPDVSISPSAKAQSADTQKLIAAMVDAFNDQLKAAVGAKPRCCTSTWPRQPRPGHQPGAVRPDQHHHPGLRPDPCQESAGFLAGLQQEQPDRWRRQPLHVRRLRAPDPVRVRADRALRAGADDRQGLAVIRY
jgi:outer membrane lipase/esterase